MTAHDRVESVLMIAWTERSRSSGIGAHDAVEYAGSNRSSHGGDEMAEAFGVAGHV
jgi:hypothetical protein